MADPIYGLTDADRRKLKQLFDDFYGESRTSPVRTQTPRDEEYLTPEIYVALTPAGGIPALAEGPDAGTAFGEGDIPGSADCQIYQVIAGSLDTITGVTRTVYNLSESDIDGDSWILATRDKFGKWWAVPSAPEAVPCPPPPPAPATSSWYCIDGVPVYVTGTAPDKFDCGPFDYKPPCDCTPITGSGGIGISDSTAYAGPYTTGSTLALSLSKTGTFTGTPTWRIYPVEPTEATNSGTDAGTGNSFSPSIEFVSMVTSSAGFVVLLTDSGDATKVAFTTVAASQQIDPAVTAVRSGAGNLTDSDAFKLTKANTPGGGFTLTLNVSALGRANSWWTIKNVGTGVLTINQTSGETINGAASITVAAGASVTLYPDNKSTWQTA